MEWQEDFVIKAFETSVSGRLIGRLYHETGGRSFHLRNPVSWSKIGGRRRILFLLSIFLHIYYNWKPIINYLRTKSKKILVITRDFNVALIVTSVVAAGTYFMIPPFSTILDISEKIKDAAALKYGEPPFGHAELAPLKSLTQKTGLELDVVLRRLDAEGIRVNSPDEIFLDIANRHGMTPKQVFEIMQSGKDTGKQSGMPDIPAPGTGSKTLSRLCVEYGLDIAIISRGLQQKGLKVNTDKKLKDLAVENNLSPIELYDLIKQISDIRA